jgi:hypothetical protein
MTDTRGGRGGRGGGKMKTAWSIKKAYTGTPTEGTGHAIDVYIETINETHREYLVHWKTLMRIAESYGLRLATPEEAKELGYPSPTETFRETFEREQRKGRMPGNSAFMREHEKNLSFLYRWFILVKQEIRMSSSSE